MINIKMIFAGFGGQGILFAGKVVVYAGLLDGYEVSWLPSYGPEMRGGTANCSVCISSQAIGFPLVTEPNILVVMNAPSFDKFIDAVAPGGKVIVDASLVDRETERTDVSVYRVPATQLSNEHHLEGIANIILLGKLLKETSFTSKEIINQAIGKCVPASKKHLLEHNIRAVELGMSL